LQPTNLHKLISQRAQKAGELSSDIKWTASTVIDFCFIVKNINTVRFSRFKALNSCPNTQKQENTHKNNPQNSTGSRGGAKHNKPTPILNPIKRHVHSLATTVSWYCSNEIIGQIELKIGNSPPGPIEFRIIAWCQKLCPNMFAYFTTTFALQNLTRQYKLEITVRCKHQIVAWNFTLLD
jgi:hypothetical protein